jgi:hypothetical protein
MVFQKANRALSGIERIVNFIPRGGALLGEKAGSYIGSVMKADETEAAEKGKKIGAFVGYAAEIVAVGTIPLVGGSIATGIAVASPALALVYDRKKESEDKKYSA